MFGLFLYFVSFVFSLTEADEEELDRIFFKPPILSDFINGRQLLNITLSGKNELNPVNGQYFTKPLFNLVQSLQPTFLTLRSMFFTSFDGMLVNGNARGLAKFADIFIYDCTFKDGNSNIMMINGPAPQEIVPSEGSPEI